MNIGEAHNRVYNQRAVECGRREREERHGSVVGARA